MEKHLHTSVTSEANNSKFLLKSLKGCKIFFNFYRKMLFADFPQVRHRRSSIFNLTKKIFSRSTENVKVGWRLEDTERVANKKSQSLNKNPSQKAAVVK